MIKSLSKLALVSCALLTSNQAVSGQQAIVSVADYSKSSFTLEALDSQRHKAKVAYKLSDDDSIASAIEKAQAVSDEMLGNSTQFGYSTLNTHITTDVQDNDVFVIVETSFMPVTEPSEVRNAMLYSQVVQSGKAKQMAIVRSVLDNSFIF
ncbi:hypothetical protein [Vibrio sp. 10N.239.312.D08]|uniref:hypothetical protein n=1 Tax=Vibrio sp. 10N.239.312.D08 TaxID=3229978 RepID=UPI00354C29C8